MEKDLEERIRLLASCGMDCALCQAYQRNKNRCPGCRNGSNRKSCINCAINLCTKKQVYCFECAEYPCARLKRLDARYKKKYGMSMLENLCCIQQSGEQEFVRRQQEKYRCPVCGKLRSVHSEECIYCSQQEKVHLNTLK